MNQSKLLRKDWDSPWKEILEVFFREFIEFCYPETEKQIDWTKKMEFLDKELQSVHQASQQHQKIVDKLVKVWLHSKEELWILVHVEVQGHKEEKFPERMFTYYYRLYDHYQVPICSIAILIDRHADWRPQHYHLEFWGVGLHYCFNMIKILDYAKERESLLASNNPFGIVIHAQLEAIEGAKENDEHKYLSKLNLTKNLYEKGFSKKQVINLFRFLDWLISLPKPLMLKYRQAISEFEEKRMTYYITSLERIGVEKGLREGVEKGLREGVEKGLREGVEKGLREGVEKGLREGVEKGLRAGLLRQLKHKFLKVPQKYQLLLQKADEKSLLSWGERILSAKTLTEIFGD